MNGNDPSSSNSRVSIPVSGFTTPLSGNVVTHIGVVAYEGDLGAIGDGVTLSDGATIPTFYPLSDVASPVDNFFNGAISRFGNAPLNSRPNFLNQMGFDITVLDAKRPGTNTGILMNGATSTTFRFVSGSPGNPGEIYYPGVFTFATDLFQPFVPVAKLVQDVNEGAVLPGDILEYIILLPNTGLDDAVNVVLTDVLPPVPPRAGEAG